MKLPRLRSAIVVSGLVAAVVICVFISIKPEAGPLRSPIPQLPQIQSASPQSQGAVRSELVPIPQSTPAAALEPTPPPPKKIRPEPLPPARVQALTQRFREIQEQIRSSTAVLKTYTEQDPDLSDVLRAKFERLGESLWFITLSQAFDDPDLRPALNSVLSRPNSVYEMLDEKAAKLGLDVKFTQARNPSEAASLLKASEQQFQNKYRELRNKYEINDELARAVESAKAGEILERYLTLYMFHLGYRYSPENQTFNWQ